MRLVLIVLFVLSGAAAVLADDRAIHLPIGDPGRKDREVPLVVDGITDAARGDTLTPVELAARLDGVRIVFVGESHTDMEFHQVQLKLIQELHRRGRPVLVGLEMYPVTEQSWLDRWNSDKRLTEERFLADSHWYRNWGYHWNYYRDIFQFARANGIHMFAVNVPRAVVQTARMKGLEALPPDQKAMLPERVELENAEHRQLFRAFFDSEDALHGNMPDDVFEGMFRAQCTWDAAMGWNALQALKQHGGQDGIMVVLIGAGHVAYGLGAERQTRLWFEGRTASVIPIPIADEPGGEPVERVQASYADFVWGLPPSTDPLYPSVGISTPEQKSGERYKVIMVAKESPAAAAGFEVGDELVSVDGQPIVDKETSNTLMSRKRWGDQVVYEVMRGGSKRTLVVHLRRRPPAPEDAEKPGVEKSGAEKPAEPTMPPHGSKGGGR
jgi:uncharacterized iron-regulated protein